MARHIYQGTAQDGNGTVIVDASVAVYLAGTLTAATIYTAATGGSADSDSIVPTDSTDGSFLFYVDGTDYPPEQLFKIIISKTHYNPITIDNIRIFPSVAMPLEAEETVTGTVTLNHWGVSLLDSSGGAVTATLPDGTQIGQLKGIGMSDASTSSTVSVTHHVTEDPEVFTFALTTDWLLLQWTGTDWVTVHNNGVTT